MTVYYNYYYYISGCCLSHGILKRRQCFGNWIGFHARVMLNFLTCKWKQTQLSEYVLFRIPDDE
jgi:hypothetical protein